MNNDTNKQETTKDPERRFIIIFCAVTAAFLAVCALVYALTDINEKNAYVTVSHMDTNSPVIPDEEKININTATAEELKTLSGIGDTTAARIIEYRETYGGFLDTDELVNVPGIGEKTLKKLKPYITI